MFKSKRYIFVLMVLALTLTTLVWYSCQKGPRSIVGPIEPGPRERIISDLPKDLDAVMRIQNNCTNRLLAIDGVVGTATAAGPDGGYAVKILTRSENVTGELPTQVEGVPVIIEVVGEIEAHDVYTGRYRPVPCGVSGGSFDYYRENQLGYVYDGGTIGCIVEKGGTKYFLSCNHVFAHANREKIGTPIVQPGLIDVGGIKNPDDIVGFLSDFNRIKWGPLRNSNVIDAAIAEIAPGVEYTSAMICGYTPSTVPATAILGMVVKKCGRTTGYTEGEVVGINVTIVVNYMPDGYARFDNQIQFTKIASSGDSGSLVVTQDGNHPVGLEFAGSDVASFGNPIQEILEYFGVSVCGN